MPGGLATEMRVAEAQRILNESNEDTTRSYEFPIIERSGLRYAVDCDDGDTVSCIPASTEMLVQRIIMGADIEATAPAPALTP